LPVVELPLTLLAVITISFTVAELPVLSTESRKQRKAAIAEKFWSNTLTIIIILLFLLINIMETTLSLKRKQHRPVRVWNKIT
jgi:hypothetical protein